MNSLQALIPLLEAKKSDFSARLAELDEKKLGRGKYLREKRALILSPEFNLLDKLSAGAPDFALSEVEQYLGLTLPECLKDFLRFSNGYMGSAFYIQNCPGIINSRKAQTAIVEIHNLFEINYLNTLEFSGYAKMPIGIWLKTNSQFYSKIFLHDLVDRKIYLVAESLEDFFEIISEAFKKGDEPVFFKGNPIKNLKFRPVYPYEEVEGKTFWDSETFFRIA